MASLLKLGMIERDFKRAKKYLHFRQRNVVDVEDAERGVLPMHNFVPRLSATPGSWRLPARKLGEHTRAVLAEVGYSNEEIK